MRLCALPAERACEARAPKTALLDKFRTARIRAQQLDQQPDSAEVRSIFEGVHRGGATALTYVAREDRLSLELASRVREKTEARCRLHPCLPGQFGCETTQGEREGESSLSYCRTSSMWFIQAHSIA